MSDGMTDADKQTRAAIEHWTAKLAREEEEKHIRKEVREKVLEELDKWIHDKTDYKAHIVNRHEILDKIKELRGEQ
jgi:hypothetical protein